MRADLFLSLTLVAFANSTVVVAPATAQTSAQQTGAVQGVGGAEPCKGSPVCAWSRDRDMISKEIDAYNLINKNISQKYGVNYLDITPSTREAAIPSGNAASMASTFTA